jgi:hypothetical protein
MVDPLVGFALMLAAFILGLIGGVRLINNNHGGNRTFRNY